MQSARNFDLCFEHTFVKTLSDLVLLRKLEYISSLGQTLDEYQGSWFVSIVMLLAIAFCGKLGGLNLFVFEMDRYKKMMILQNLLQVAF